MIEHWYFRDHDAPGWGVKRGQAGAVDGITVVTGLDKSIAAAVALLLDGKVRQARGLLDVFDYLPDVPVPDGKPRVALTVRLPNGTVTADLAAKSVRRAIAAVREHGPEGAAAIVQGRLVGTEITEAGLAVQPKVAKPEPVA